jgi:hypothetical protein
VRDFPRQQAVFDCLDLVPHDFPSLMLTLPVHVLVGNVLA